MVHDTDDQIRKSVSEIEVERAETIENLRIEVVDLKADLNTLITQLLSCRAEGMEVAAKYLDEQGLTYHAGKIRDASEEQANA